MGEINDIEVECNQLHEIEENVQQNSNARNTNTNRCDEKEK